MLEEFEQLAKQYPHETCFTFIDAKGRAINRDYASVRFQASLLARMLERQGVQRGDFVSLDMANCPAFVVAIVAAAYGGFTLVILNHRLTKEEKEERLSDLRRMRQNFFAAHLTESTVEELIEQGKSSEEEGSTQPRSLRARKGKRVWGRERALSGSLGATAAAQSEALHCRERGAAFFDQNTPAIVLFTSGTSGRPKAVSLTWAQLKGAAEASNTTLNTWGKGLWQIALPLFHIGGFEIVIRSILNATPFVLYQRFDAARVLEDAHAYGATHISVVDKMLCDMLASPQVAALKRYTGILLGGAATNPVTLVRAVAEGAQVWASYGMTETASQIASVKVTEDYDGSLTLLPGYEVQIISPDERGYGQLAVKGPGVFEGYLNARAAFTPDGFFLTGDRAKEVQGRIKVQERVSDMFVSGGENIYPAEIRTKLLRIAGVADAYVFGAEDEVWGRRPIAFVERSASDTREAEKPLHQFAKEVQQTLDSRVSKLHRPRHVYALPAFPRKGIGKVDRAQIHVWYEQRIEVSEVTLYHLRQNLRFPFKTAKTTMQTRESLIVEVKDKKGRRGLGECVAFPTDWYLPETIAQDKRVLEDYLIPLVLQQTYLHPREASPCFCENDETIAFPMARGALEPALWDLYGKIVRKPLWQLINEEVPWCKKASHGEGSGEAAKRNTAPVTVPAGIVIGLQPLSKTLERVQQAVDAGYTRVKLKIAPGDDLERVQAVRKAFPKLLIILDANQAYTERDSEIFKALDTLDLCCIEEPLNPREVPEGAPLDFFERLAQFQTQIATPICLDESLVTAADFARALTIPGLTCYTLKIAKLGGIAPALDFYHKAHAQGCDLWMGGMYETSISKRMHAAFETLPGIVIPGDLGDSSSYFTTEIAQPPFVAHQGRITLNEAGNTYGLGCELDAAVVDQVLVEVQHFS